MSPSFSFSAGVLRFRRQNHHLEAVGTKRARLKSRFGDITHSLRRVLALIFRPANSYSFVPWRLAAERGADFHI